MMFNIRQSDDLQKPVFIPKPDHSDPVLGHSPDQILNSIRRGVRVRHVVFALPPSDVDAATASNINFSLRAESAANP